MNRSEVEELEDKAMEEEKEKKQLPALYFFDKSTLAWLTLGLLIGLLPSFLGGKGHHEKSIVAGSFVRGPWTQDVLELLRGYRWNPWKGEGLPLLNEYENIKLFLSCNMKRQLHCSEPRHKSQVHS